jgi:hypothetical protein
MTAASQEDAALNDESPARTAPARRGECSSDEAPDGFRPLASLAFWCCLGMSATILAAVVLAPRLRAYRDLSRQYDALECELIAAQRRVDYLQKVVDALQHDSQFAAELARVDFGLSGMEERFPVSPALNLSGPPMSAPAAAVTLEASRPISQNLLNTPLLDTFSNDRTLRISLLAAGSFLVLVAFTLLCDKRAPLEQNGGVGWHSRCRQWLGRRYTPRRL